MYRNQSLDELSGSGPAVGCGSGGGDRDAASGDAPAEVGGGDASDPTADGGTEADAGTPDAEQGDASDAGPIGPSLVFVAGTLGGAGYADDVGTAARFTEPHGLARDGAGNVYIADSGNHVIRKLDIATGRVYDHRWRLAADRQHG